MFTGLFFRDEIAAYYRANDLPVPYGRTARRKIMPETLEQRVLAAFGEHGGGRLFRKTSCAASYAHGLPDYNGHVDIRQLCDICPAAQLARCLAAHQVPTAEQVKQAASALPEAAGFQVMDITDRAVVVNGLPSEQPRYFMQHAPGSRFTTRLIRTGRAVTAGPRSAGSRHDLLERAPVRGSRCRG